MENPALALSPVEAWGFFHNGVVDHAAVEVNSRRGDRFHEVWKAAKVALERVREVHRCVTRVHVLTSRRAVASQPKQPTNASAHRARVQLPAEEMQAHASTVVSWGWSPDMVARFGRSNLEEVTRWWREIELGTQKKWVSWCVLFGDFLLTVGGYGPRYDVGLRQWVPSSQPLPATCSRSFMQRTRSFQTFVNAVRLHNGFDPSIRYTRCSSSVVNVRLNCVHLYWPDSRMVRFDRCLAATCGVVRNPQQLNSFDVRGEPR